MSRQDPKGYYALLGVSPNASASDIKTTFHQYAKQLHPDHNKTPNAARDFQRFNEAYEILITPETRAQYDTLGTEISYSTPKNGQIPREEPVEPLVCSLCQKVTAQPRYVIFYNVKSFLIMTYRTPVQGIFCRSCADEKAFRSTVTTWLLGWWGFPWGIIYSIHAIINNLSGGSQPKDVNARLLSYQAFAFATQGKYDLARSVGMDALDLSRKSDSIASDLKRRFGGESNEILELQTILINFLQSVDNGKPINRLQNTWAILSGSFYIQLALIVTAIVVAFNFIPLNSQNVSLRNPQPQLTFPTKPTYVRPKVADNGSPFPENSDYIDGYPGQTHTLLYISIRLDFNQFIASALIKKFLLRMSSFTLV